MIDELLSMPQSAMLATAILISKAAASEVRVWFRNACAQADLKMRLLFIVLFAEKSRAKTNNPFLVNVIADSVLSSNFNYVFLAPPSSQLQIKSVVLHITTTRPTNVESHRFQESRKVPIRISTTIAYTKTIQWQVTYTHY